MTNKNERFVFLFQEYIPTFAPCRSSLMISNNFLMTNRIWWGLKKIRCGGYQLPLCLFLRHISCLQRHPRWHLCRSANGGRPVRLSPGLCLTSLWSWILQMFAGSSHLICGTEWGQEQKKNTHKEEESTRAREAEKGQQTSTSLCLKEENSAHKVKNCKCLPVLLCTIVSYGAVNRQKQCSSRVSGRRHILLLLDHRLRH